MEKRERFKVEEYGGDYCDFEKSSIVEDAFELLNPNDFPEEQRKIVEEFNRRAEIGNQRHRIAMYRAEMFEKGFNAGMYICTFDHDENMTSFVFTDETRRMLGYDGLDDLPNEFDSWVKTLLPEQRDAMVPIFWSTVKAHRELPDISHAEYPMVRKDGKIIWVTGAGRFIRRKDGSLEIYMGCYRDVTAEHEKDDYLHIIEGIGRIFNFSLYIDMANETYQIVSTNEYVERVQKNPNAFQFLRDNVDSSVHPDYKDELKAWLQPEVISELLMKKDTISKDFFSAEAEMWFRGIFMVGDKNEDGTLKHIFYGCQDITYEKRHELAQRARLEQALTSLRESSEMLDRVHEVLGSATWKAEYDKAGNEMKVEFSDGVRHLFGYKDETVFPNSLDFILSHVLDMDYGHMMKEIYGVLMSRDQSRVTISTEYRAFRADGVLRWYRTQGLVKRRTDGTPQMAYGVIMDITELEEAENGQREALAAFESLHDALGSANWQMNFDKTGKMTACIWSDRFRKMLGYKDLRDFPNKLSSWTDLLHPEDKERTLQAYWAAVNDHTGKNMYSVQYRLMTKAGVYRWYSAHGSLTRYEDGTPKIYYGLFLDINDQVLAEESQEKHLKEIMALNAQLEENQTRLEEAAAEQEAQLEEITALNETLQEAQKAKEEEHRIIDALAASYLNVYSINIEKRTVEILKLNGYLTAGLSKEKAGPYPYAATCRAYISNRVYADDQQTVAENMSLENLLLQLKDRKEYEFTYRVPENGGISYYQGKYVAVEGGIVCGFQNIDEMVIAERERNRELEEAKKEAEAANAAKTSFLFNMSHDIRTPMNAIMGFRELLEKHQEEPEKRQDYLNKIQDASAVLLSIINNVLEMARIEKGTLEIDEIAWSTEQFNDTLYSVFQTMMTEKGLTFTRQIKVEHHYVYCDPTKLREIFINILSNAYKYTNTGGKVNMHLEEIPSDREGWVLYQTTISDTGIGMSEEFLPHLFEEFSREQNTTDAKVEGTGLGMPIVKRLVEMLDGTIEVTSRKGEGSTFIVTIPHRIADKADLTDHAGIELDPNLFKGKHILLTEDNDLNAEIAMEILEEAGFIVDRAEDGRICLDMLEKAEAGHYDLILMDIQMPNMNGYETTRAIRQLEDYDKASIKIVAMTANAFEEDKREALRAGMNGHIAKPINVKELMRTLSTIIG